MSSTSSITLTPPSQTLAGEALCSRCRTEESATQLQSLQNAQARIKDLESQVKILTLRATSAVERATEYEVSLRRRTTAPNRSSQHVVSPGNQSQLQIAAASAKTPNSPPQTSTSRLARLLSTRNPTPTELSPASRSTPVPQAFYTTSASLASPLGVDPSTSEVSLLDALTHEKSLRQAAETAAAQTNSEIEELTGQLFEQANEMVATERKARAKLEARVEILEKRDDEKARRLGLLEMRVQRVERVRGLLEGDNG